MHILGHCPFISEQNGNVVSSIPREGVGNANVRNRRGRVFPLLQPSPPAIGAVCLQLADVLLCQNKKTIPK